MDSFLAPTLSLPTQLEMEKDRRAAARMSRDQLAERLAEMIQTWYLQHQMINEMLGAIRQLQVQVALAGDPKPPRNEPEPQHYLWAAQVMAKLVEDGLMVPPPVEAEAEATTTCGRGDPSA
jgi:hypothetical protein